MGGPGGRRRLGRERQGGEGDDRRGELDAKYGPGWEEWLTSTDFPEFTDVVKNLKEKFKRAPAKGAGKGKSKSKELGKGWPIVGPVGREQGYFTRNVGELPGALA